MRFVMFLACAACINAQTPVDKAWTILSEAAKGKSDDNRGKAIHALGLITGNARARTLAETALSDDEEEVRATAARVLGIMGAKESAPKLKAALKDKETSVVFAAANALFVLGDPTAYDVYYAVLTGQRKSGDNLVDSQLKMLKDPKALGQMGVEFGIGFIPFGGISYGVVKMLKADNVSPVRAAAATKLIGDPDPKSRKALMDATKDEKWLVRAAVIGALARQNDPAALKVITPLLDDDEEVVRFNAAAAVIQLSAAAPASAGNE
ncbi:MAG TPA: HEAT repeat domain-containing protein [Bryobacteraceae bacterium]|nr:HEAT repeat domain-containing protein [Bryobacteraceae bacterium]